MADAKGTPSSGGAGGGGGGAGHGDFVAGAGGQQRYQGIHAAMHQQPVGQNVHHLYPAGVIQPAPAMPVQVPLPYVPQLNVAPPPLLQPQHRGAQPSQMPAHETFQDWSAPSNNNVAALHAPSGFQDWRMSNGSFMSFGPTAANNNVFYPNMAVNTWPANNMPMINPVYASYPPAIEDHKAPSFHNSNHEANSGFATNLRLDPTYVSASPFPPMSSSSYSFSSNQNSEEPTNAKKVKTSDVKDPPRVIGSSDVEIEKIDELDHIPVGELPSLNQNHEPLIVRFNCREYRVILRKDLTNSDVGNIGRIVMPKRDAETHLPQLQHREGVVLTMDDFKIATTWEFKYRFWPNNKSRMYVLESTGGFVKEHGLQTGDIFIIYKSLESGKYVVRGEKSIKPNAVMPVLDCSCKEELNSNEECGFAISLQARRT